MAHHKVQEMIEAATRDVEHLRYARSSAAAREHWHAFLEHANRAVNRLEGYAKRTGQSAKYKTLVAREVWSSDLTKYMRLARNHHEHGVVDLEVDNSYNQRIALPDGNLIGMPVVHGVNQEGEIVTMTPIAPMEFCGGNGARVVNLSPGIEMVPLRDKQGEYVMPPHVPGLQTADEPSVAAAAREYLRWVVEQVNTFG